MLAHPTLQHTHHFSNINHLLPHLAQLGISIYLNIWGLCFYGKLSIFSYESSAGTNVLCRQKKKNSMFKDIFQFEVDPPPSHLIFDKFIFAMLAGLLLPRQNLRKSKIVGIRNKSSTWSLCKIDYTIYYILHRDIVENILTFEYYFPFFFNIYMIWLISRFCFTKFCPPINKQNKHGLRRPPPLKCLYNTWMAICSNMRNILYQIQAS